MKDIPKNLKEQMENKRKELEDAIHNELPYSNIVAISQELDDIISQYINNTEKTSKEEIIVLMKNDLKDIFSITNEKELEHASNNLFTMCYLKSNNVPEQEIATRIVNGDKIFNSQNEDIDFTTNNSKVPLDEYLKLVDKYVKIIKERM